MQKIALYDAVWQSRRGFEALQRSDAENAKETHRLSVSLRLIPLERSL